MFHFEYFVSNGFRYFVFSDSLAFFLEYYICYSDVTTLTQFGLGNASVFHFKCKSDNMQGQYTKIFHMNLVHTRTVYCHNTKIHA